MLIDNRCASDAPSRAQLDDLPLAIAYVPWQSWGQLYGSDVALDRGTVFPALDKPFERGPENEGRAKENYPLSAVMQASFAVDDLKLYVNTHPDDDDAFDALKDAIARREQAISAMEDACSPLTVDGVRYLDQYNWINRPWPWEVDF